MGTEQASSIDEVISRSQGGAGVAPPASPGLLTINDLNARRSSNVGGSESAASSSWMLQAKKAKASTNQRQR